MKALENENNSLLVLSIITKLGSKEVQLSPSINMHYPSSVQNTFLLVLVVRKSLKINIKAFYLCWSYSLFSRHFKRKLDSVHFGGLKVEVLFPW